MRNFTSDWNDGTVVAALVDSIAPGLLPEAEVMEPKNALENATMAMKLAEEWLGVPMVSDYYIQYIKFNARGFKILQRISIASWMTEICMFFGVFFFSLSKKMFT